MYSSAYRSHPLTVIFFQLLNHVLVNRVHQVQHLIALAAELFDKGRVLHSFFAFSWMQPDVCACVFCTRCMLIVIGIELSV